jgi:hypothetical protein
MNKLNVKKLLSENRYGQIRFTIDILFELNKLRKYIIPIKMSVLENEHKISESSYSLICLSNYFDSLPSNKSMSEIPYYKIVFSQNNFESDKFSINKL